MYYNSMTQQRNSPGAVTNLPAGSREHLARYEMENMSKEALDG